MDCFHGWTVSTGQHIKGQCFIFKIDNETLYVIWRPSGNACYSLL